MLRGFTYQAIGQLGERAPSLVRGDPDVPRQLFHALAVEPPGVRSSLQEALAALSHAYKGISGNSLLHTIGPILLGKALRCKKMQQKLYQDLMDCIIAQ